MTMVLIVAAAFCLTYGFLDVCNRLGLYLQSRGFEPHDPGKSTQAGSGDRSERQPMEAQIASEGRVESFPRWRFGLRFRTPRRDSGSMTGRANKLAPNVPRKPPTQVGWRFPPST